MRNIALKWTFYAFLCSILGLISASSNPIYIITFLGLIYTSYAIWVYFRIYLRDFADGERLPRNHAMCPTSVAKDPPDVRSWKDNQQRILDASKLHPSNFATCKLLNDVKVVDHDKQIHRKTLDRPPLKRKASRLDMDHIYITYPQLLWAFTFVGPFSYFLWKKETFILRVRIFLVKKGLMDKKPVDMEALVGKLVLEQSQAIHYVARTSKGSEPGNIAGFFFTGTCADQVFTWKDPRTITNTSIPSSISSSYVLCLSDFPYVDDTGQMQTADLFVVGIDLETRKMV